MKEFSGNALRNARKLKGFTQKDLGLTIGTSERVVQYWESGSTEPTATFLLRMMILLGCEADVLLSDE